MGTDSASHLEDLRYHRQAGRQAYRQAGACKRWAWHGMGIVAGHGSAGQGRDGHNGSAYDRAWKRRAGDIGHGERNSRVWKGYHMSHGQPWKHGPEDKQQGTTPLRSDTGPRSVHTVHTSLVGANNCG